MKLNSLRDFMAVAERGSLRAAARQLGLAQPAITRSIQELEKELKVILFERQSTGVRLTPVGEVFLRRAQAVRNELRRAQEEIEQIQGSTHGHIRMCLSSAAHMSVYPEALGPFRQRFPEVTLELIDAVLPTVEKELKDSAIDFYVGPIHGAVSSDLVAEKLFDNQRVILGRKGHPLANARSLRDLSAAQWVSSPNLDGSDSELSRIFAQHGLQAPKVVVQGHSALSYLMTIANSDFLMVLPIQWAQVDQFLPFLQRINVAEHLPAPPICLIYRKGMPLTPAAEYFCDMVRRASVRMNVGKR